MKNFVRTVLCISGGVVFCILAISSLSAQTLTTLQTFDGAFTGGQPGAVVMGVNGNLAGVTTQLGPESGGTLYEMTTSGQFIKQYYFSSEEGTGPSYPLGLIVSSKQLYGVSLNGGTNDYGTVFKIANGKLSVEHSFCSQPNCADGSFPQGAPIVASNGNVYGTTQEGGPYYPNCDNYDYFGCGVVYQITPDGTYSVMYDFCSQADCADGAGPIAGLVQGRDGNLYGTTVSGGNPCNCGTLFKITPSGQLKTLYEFCSEENCVDGSLPDAALIEGRDGNFYGTTLAGGTKDASCPLSQYGGCGTAFKITPQGELTTLHTFCEEDRCPDGYSPSAPLVQASDGNFYGTTYFGGRGMGTIFRMTSTGNLKTLYSFCSQKSCLDGASPNAGLVQASDGNFYGTTSGSGGDEGYGTVFQFSLK